MNLIHSISQLLGDGLPFEGVHVETVSLGGEDEECYHSDVTVAGLEVMVESSQGLYEQVSSLVGELIPGGVVSGGTDGEWVWLLTSQQ